MVDLNTGMITTSCSDCSSQLDREMVDIYFMTYTATDRGGRSNSTSLTIRVTDDNDNVPVFTRQIYTAFIGENDLRYNNSTAVIEVEVNIIKTVIGVPQFITVHVRVYYIVTCIDGQSFLTYISFPILSRTRIVASQDSSHIWTFAGIPLSTYFIIRQLK